jgi:hypothetical protein
METLESAAESRSESFGVSRTMISFSSTEIIVPTDCALESLREFKFDVCFEQAAVITGRRITALKKVPFSEPPKF